MFIETFKESFDIRIQSNHIAYDVGPKSVSKGDAVKTVLKELNMNKDCSYAFGNGANDFEMLKNVGHPYAMHNSETELLRAIKSVTDDVLDDKVYKQLKKLLLIN